MWQSFVNLRDGGRNESDLADKTAFLCFSSAYLVVCLEFSSLQIRTSQKAKSASSGVTIMVLGQTYPWVLSCLWVLAEPFWHICVGYLLCTHKERDFPGSSLCMWKPCACTEAQGTRHVCRWATELSRYQSLAAHLSGEKFSPRRELQKYFFAAQINYFKKK